MPLPCPAAGRKDPCGLAPACVNFARLLADDEKRLGQRARLGKGQVMRGMHGRVWKYFGMALSGARAVAAWVGTWGDSAVTDFSREKALLAQGLGPVCGIDEAGRGPLCGPVVAACVVLNAARLPDGIADSKRLSEAARERLAEEIRACARVGVGLAAAAEIDAQNIHHATLLAMRRAFDALPGERPAMALVDGKFAPELPCAAEAVVKGDDLVLSIAAASIIAKVERDRIMKELDARYPLYGLARHKGYPTKAHIAALQEHGPCPEHRRSFAPVREACRVHGA